MNAFSFLFLISFLFSAHVSAQTHNYSEMNDIQKERVIRRIYQGSFHRDPDAGAMEFLKKEFSSGGLSKILLHTKGSVHSEEYHNEIKAKKSSEEILAQMYEGYLGPNRPVDPSGKAAYLPLLNTGKDEEVVTSLVSSDEFYNKINAIEDKSLISTMIKKAYSAILFREADEGGLNHYISVITDRGFQGWVDTLKAMTNSKEFHDNQSGKASTELLANFYEKFLGPNRPVDPTGEKAWTPLLEKRHFDQVVVGVANSQEFWNKVASTEPPSLPTHQRKGIVRKCDKAVCDDDGSFNALGATMMWAAWAFKNDKPKLEKNLAYLRDNGFDYIRALGVVGRLPWWEGRVIDWKWSDYDQVIAGLTDLAYDKYGLRVEWTLIGDGDQMIPNKSDRYKLIDRFIAMSKNREHKIMHFEIANEGWQNGFEGESGYKQLGELTRYMNDKTNILVAASAPSSLQFDGDVCKEAEAYNPGNADLWTFHYDRYAAAVDGFWRHVRQPWESCDAFASNNEPMGPGSSVAKTTNPYYIVAAAMNSYISQVAMYVWHTESGVWGGTITEEEGKSDLYQNPSGSAFRTMKKLLPEGLAGWTRQNTYHNRHHPFLVYADGNADRIWPEGYSNGVVRAYGAVKGSDFVVLPIGIKKFVKMEAQKSMKFKVYDIITGDALKELSLKAGQSFTLNEDGKGTYLIIGTYN